MATDRLAQLRALLADDPTDPFLLYAIALEIIHTQPTEAGRLFEELLKNHANYLPTYYTAAQFYIEQDKIELAEQTYKTGILLAETQQNLKTLAELKNAYQNWLFDLD